MAEGTSVQLAAPSGMALAAGRSLSREVTLQGFQAQGLMAVNRERPGNLGAPTSGRDRATVGCVIPGGHHPRSASLCLMLCLCPWLYQQRFLLSLPLPSVFSLRNPGCDGAVALDLECTSINNDSCYVETLLTNPGLINTLYVHHHRDSLSQLNGGSSFRKSTLDSSRSLTR